jgi:NADH-quinone oxidoreductase subunit G
MLDLDNFDYFSVDEISKDIDALVADVKISNEFSWSAPQITQADTRSIQRIYDFPMYAIDNITRRAAALQQTQDAKPAAVYVNSDTAANLGLTEGDNIRVDQNDSGCELDVVIDETIADACVYIPAAKPETICLPAASEEIRISKVGGNAAANG